MGGTSVGQFASSAGDGFSNFYGGLRDGVVGVLSDPIGAYTDYYQSEGYKNFIPGYVAYNATIGNVINSFGTAYDVGSNLVGGNYSAAGNSYGNFLGGFSLEAGTAGAGGIGGRVVSGITNGVNRLRSFFRQGGRLGNRSTRRQIRRIARELQRRGYSIEGGGGLVKEEYLRPIGGGRKGGSYLDLTASHPDYPTVRINTVDMLKTRIRPTARELRNAARIRNQIAPGEHLLLIPKG